MAERPSSATAATRRADCNCDGLAPFAAAHWGQAANISYHKRHWDSIRGFRVGHTKHNKPTAPHKMTGSRNRQLRSISTTLAVHEPLSDDPLPTTRECEKNRRATINDKAEMQDRNNPSRRRVEMLINVMPPNLKAQAQPPETEHRRSRRTTNLPALRKLKGQRLLPAAS